MRHYQPEPPSDAQEARARDTFEDLKGYLKVYSIGLMTLALLPLGTFILIWPVGFYLIASMYRHTEIMDFPAIVDELTGDLYDYSSCYD